MAIKHIVKTSVGEKLGAWKQIMSLMQHDLLCRSILRAPPATTHVPDLLTKATAGARSARRASTNFIVSDCFHVLARVTVFTTSVLLLLFCGESCPCWILPRFRSFYTKSFSVKKLKLVSHCSLFVAGALSSETGTPPFSYFSVCFVVAALPNLYLRRRRLFLSKRGWKKRRSLAGGPGSKGE